MPGELVLTALERCDVRACGARAWVRAYFAPTSFIQFCLHHGNEQPVSLWSDSLYVIDERAYVLGFPEGD